MPGVLLSAAAPRMFNIVSVSTTKAGPYRARANNNVCTYRYLRDDSATREMTYNSLNGLVVVTKP